MPRLRTEDSGGYKELHTDDAGRVVLTQDLLGSLGKPIYIMNWIEDCVRVCSRAGLEQIKEHIDNGPMNDEQRAWVRRITAIETPRTVTPDGNGRVRIPGECLDYADIGRSAQVLVLPMGEGIFEVWDKAKYLGQSKAMAAEIRKLLWAAPATPTAGE